MEAFKYGHAGDRLTTDTQYPGDVTGSIESDIQQGKRSPAEALSYYQQQEEQTVKSGVNKL
jgi:hypothetical protein